MTGRYMRTLDVGIGELGRPEWHQRAACRGIGADKFFGDVRVAPLSLCETCPVWLECHIQGQSERFGIWAGGKHAMRWQAEDRRPSRARRAS